MRRLALLRASLVMAGLMGCSKSDSVTGPPPPPVPAQWTRLSSGLPGGSSIDALTASGTTLLAGTEVDGVFRSTDGGLTWTAATTQPTNATITALTASGTTFLAGTDGGGVFRSTDGGLTWTVDTTQPADLYIHSLTASGTTLLAGTRSAGIWGFGL